MLSSTFIHARFDQLPPEKKIAILFKALDLMKEDNDRFVAECLALAMEIPLFPKVERILNRNGYQLSLLFTHGEERLVDFREFFSSDRVYEKILLENIDQFDQVQVEDDTLVWPKLGYWSEGVDGEQQFMYYDIDPALLYEAGEAMPVNVS